MSWLGKFLFAIGVVSAGIALYFGVWALVWLLLAIGVCCMAFAWGWDRYRGHEDDVAHVAAGWFLIGLVLFLFGLVIAISFWLFRIWTHG